MSQYLGISAAVCRWLTERGIPAREGWSGGMRSAPGEAFVLVTVREYSACSAGFEHYLGEQYNEETAAWEELYGRKVELTLGLDLYARERESEGALQELVQQVAGVLTLGSPEGLHVERITCGETGWSEEQRCLKKEIHAVCTAWLRAACTEGGEFLDFELRGGWKH